MVSLRAADPKVIMKSSFDNKYMISGFGYLGALAIGSFAVVRFIQGDIQLLIIDSFLSISLLCISTYIHVTGNLGVTKYLAAVVALFGPLLITLYTPDTGMHWLYVVAVTFYFILPLKQASLFSLLLLTGTALILVNQLETLRFVSLISTLFLISGFAFMFAYSGEHFRGQLDQLSKQDELTGAGNRRAFMAHAEQAIRQYKRNGHISSLIYIDVDNFKQVNDEFGHSLGDSVLQSVVSCIQSNLRENDKLFRLGGDEFVVIAAGAKLQHAAQVAERLRQDLENQKVSEYGITLSIGISAIQDRDSVDNWVARADEALYQSKQSGRNRVSIERPSHASSTS